METTIMGLSSNSQKKFRKLRKKLKASTPEEYDEIEKKLMKDLFLTDDTIVGHVRITAGKAKNIKLDIPRKTRPLTDRMKTQIFDTLQRDIYKRTVLDLYAGSGSFGLEALSRGAKSVTFVDAAKQAEKILEKNIKKTGFQLESTVVREKCVDFVKGSVTDGDVYEIIFIDPPYKKYKRKDKNEVEFLINEVEKLLPGISSNDKSLFKGVIILKHPRTYPIENLQLRSIELLDTYTYGMNAISLFIIDGKKIEI